MSSDHKGHVNHPIGTVITMTGVVALIGARGSKRILKLGDTLSEGDTVVTGDGSEMTIGLVDGTKITVGHDSEVTLDTDIYNA